VVLYLLYNGTVLTTGLPGGAGGLKSKIGE